MLEDLASQVKAFKFDEAHANRTEEENFLVSSKLGGIDTSYDTPQGFEQAADALTPYGDAKAIYDYFSGDKKGMAGALFAVLSMIGIPDEALKTIKSVRTFGKRSSGTAPFKDAHVFVNPSKYDIERAEIGIKKLARKEGMDQYSGDKIEWRGVHDKVDDVRYIWPSNEALHDDVVKFLGVEKQMIDPNTLMFLDRAVTSEESA